MSNYYFKRYWEESTGQDLTNSWGPSTYYFETDHEGSVLRQIEIFQNGNKLKYDQDHPEDDYGGLSDQQLDMDEFNDFKIDKSEFEKKWS